MAISAGVCGASSCQDGCLLFTEEQLHRRLQLCTCICICIYSVSWQAETHGCAGKGAAQHSDTYLMCLAASSTGVRGVLLVSLQTAMESRTCLRLLLWSAMKDERVNVHKLGPFSAAWRHAGGVPGTSHGGPEAAAGDDEPV